MAEKNDLIFMKQALELAKKALKAGEVPVGALIVQKNQVIAEAFNQKEGSKQPTAHAEILAIERAGRFLNGWRLNNSTLYVTLEPCLMCAGAIISARLKRLVYGCKDPKAGAVDSLYQVLRDTRLNHQTPVLAGLLAEESSTLLKSFFQKKR